MKKPRADMPAKVIGALLGCVAVLLCGIELQERARLHPPPAEYVYWETPAPASKNAVPQSEASREQSASGGESSREENAGAGEDSPPPVPVEPPEENAAASPPQAVSSGEGARVKVYLDEPESDFFPEEEAPPEEEISSVQEEPELPDEEASESSREEERETFDPNGVVNLNSAGLNELQSLKGIGEVLAQRIIDYRETSGGFHSIEEIMNVKGIAQGKFAAIRERITV